LVGRKLEVLRGGPRQLVVKLLDGGVMRLPRGWTDADGVSEGREGIEAVFTVDGIRELSDLVAAVRRRAVG
jgi:hypothetical protein